MAFDPNVTPIDYILLADKRSPGLAKIKGAGSPRNFDERQGYGVEGAWTFFTGLGIAKFTVELQLITAQDWIDWDAFRPLVAKPPRRVRPQALDIWHPWLEMLDVKSVSVSDLKQPEDNDDGSWTIPIEFTEYRRPLPRPVKPLDGSRKKKQLDEDDVDLILAKQELVTQQVISAATPLIGN